MRMVRWLLLSLAGAGVTLSGAEDPLENQLVHWAQRVDRDPVDWRASAMLAGLYIKAGKERGDDACFEKAEAAAKQALERNPKAYDALLGLAGALSAQHKFQAAAQAAERAIEVDPARPDAYGVRAAALMEYGNLEGASAVYAQFKAKGAHPFEWATHQANFAFASGDSNKALKFLDKALDVADDQALPKDAYVWCFVRQAELLRMCGKYDEAQAELKRALEIRPDEFAGLVQRARLNLASGAAAQAVADALAIVARMPHPELLELLAEAHEAAGQKEEAQAAWARAKEAYAEAAASDNAHDYRNLAHYLAGPGGNPEQAVAFARKDLELRRDAYAFDALAWALHKAGKSAEGAEGLRPFLDRLPEDPELFARAGQVLLAAGDREAGRKLLKRALDLHPRHPQRAELEALLK